MVLSKMVIIALILALFLLNCRIQFRFMKKCGPCNEEQAGDIPKGYDYIDITGTEVSISDTAITCEIIVVSIPDQLLFNHAAVELGYAEYRWVVYFDIDNDGLDEFYFSIAHNKFSEGEFYGDILSNTEHIILRKGAGPYYYNLCPLDASIDRNTFILETPKSRDPALLNITDRSSITVETSYNDGVDSVSDCCLYQ